MATIVVFATDKDGEGKVLEVGRYQSPYEIKIPIGHFAPDIVLTFEEDMEELAMKAVWNNTTIAEAPKEDLIRIEGNWYFPPTSLKKEYFKESDHHTTCHWKGEASYFDIVVGDETNSFGAWYYPEPKPGSIERVGRDFSHFVAFWNGIEVVE